MLHAHPRSCATGQTARAGACRATVLRTAHRPPRASSPQKSRARPHSLSGEEAKDAETIDRRDRRGAGIARKSQRCRLDALRAVRIERNHEEHSVFFVSFDPIVSFVVALDPYGGRRPPSPASHVFFAISAPSRSLR